MRGQYAWWAIGMLLLWAWFIIGNLGVAHVAVKVILR